VQIEAEMGQIFEPSTVMSLLNLKLQRMDRGLMAFRLRNGVYGNHPAAAHGAIAPQCPILDSLLGRLPSAPPMAALWHRDRGMSRGKEAHPTGAYLGTFRRLGPSWRSTRAPSCPAHGAAGVTRGQSVPAPGRSGWHSLREGKGWPPAP